MVKGNLEYFKFGEVQTSLISQDVFICVKCNQEFMSKSFLEEHKLSCSGIKAKNALDSNEALIKEKVKKNISQSSFNNQNKSFENVTEDSKLAIFNNIKKKDKERLENVYMCIHCNKEFRSKISCSSHKIECDLNNANSNQAKPKNGSLIDHKSLINHEDDNDEAANETYDTFNGNSTAYNKKPVLIKSGTYVYMCTDCSKPFTRKVNLLKHRAVHTGENVFSCDQCQKGFDSHFDLKNHNNNLHKSRIFVCPNCNKEFESKISYSSHKIECGPFGVLSNQVPKQSDNRSGEEAGGRRTFPKINHNMKKSNTDRTKVDNDENTGSSKHRVDHKGVIEFSCDKCTESFDESFEFKRHKKDVHDSSFFICSRCNEEFETKISCIMHKKKCNYIKPLNKIEEKHTCVECNKPFATKRTLTKHIESHAGVKKYRCNKCPKGYTDLRNLKKHVEKKHKEKYVHATILNPIQNLNIDKDDITNKEKAHSQIHKIENEDNSSSLELVMPPNIDRQKQKNNQNKGIKITEIIKVEKMSDKKTKIEAENSQTSYIEPPSIKGKEPNINKKNIAKKIKRKKENIKTSKKKNYKTYICTDCNRSFESKWNLTRHKTRHSNEKLFNCDQCTKGYSDSRYLKKHINNSHNGTFILPKSMSYSCTIHDCNRSFQSVGSLKTHIRKHSGKRPFFCQQCPKTFKREQSLKLHAPLHSSLKIYTKNNEKRFVCEVCTKSFNSLSINRHRATHDEQKPYSCNVCSKSFSQKNYFETHQRVVHLGEKPNTCTVCNKCFAEARSLEVHMRKHTGEKPFPCEVCLKAFRSKVLLMSHKRNIH